MPKISPSVISVGALLLGSLMGFAAVNAAPHPPRQGTEPVFPTESPTASPADTPISTGPGDQRQVFISTLSPVNANTGVTTGSETGSATIVVDGDRLGIFMQGSNLIPGIPHSIHIHKGNQCATPADDVNQDGFIDVNEGTVTTGGILVPLDGDLNSFQFGSGFFPFADSVGELSYIGSASLTALMNDLHRPPLDPSLGVATLGQDESLNLAEAVIEVHGVSPSSTIPATVQSVSGLTPNLTLAVACGTITQVSGPVPSPSPSPAATETPEPAPTPSPVMTMTPEPSATPEPTMSPEPTMNPEPTATPTQTPTMTPTATPTSGPGSGGP